MTLRDIMNVFPNDRCTHIDLWFFNEYEDFANLNEWVSFAEDRDNSDIYGLTLFEHFADATVLEISEGFHGLKITVDMKVNTSTVINWVNDASYAVYGRGA